MLRAWWLPVTAAAALAAALRVPFLTTGLGADEGGYAYVARAWANGGHLYSGTWVDRPQGLLVAYRALLTVADKPWAVRLGALLAGVGVTVLLAVIGRLLHSYRAGIAAAAVYAIIGVGPHLQGFTFNGEMAAVLPSTAAVACALVWRGGRGSRWLVAAGICGGLAILMKQSGFDGLFVAAAVAMVTSDGAAAQRLRRLGLVAAGAAIPLGASVIHGLAVGWHDYWHAVVGYRASQDLSARLGARPHLLLISLGGAGLDLGVVTCVAAAGVVWLLHRRMWIAPAWLLAAFAGFNTGGLYWPHYYIQLMPPLALLAGLAAATVKSRRVMVAAAAAAVAPVLVTLTVWAVSSPAGIPFYKTARRDTKIASFIDGHSRPCDTIYALESQGDLYFLADRGSAYPYIWGHPLHELPPGLRGLREVLAGPRRPKFVVLFESPAVADPSGRLAAVLARDYRFAWRVPPRGARVFADARRSGGCESHEPLAQLP